MLGLSCILGALAFYMMQAMKKVRNPIMYLFYSQIAISYDAVFLHNLVQQSDNLVLPGGYGSSRVCRVQAMGHNKIKKRG